MKLILPLVSYLLVSCCLSAQAQRRGVYTNLAAALRQPAHVRVLDLRGQYLTSLPPACYSLANLEVILLSDKRRNLWLYPRAWKYKFHFKHLPAGGYHHLQGRGAGTYYHSNGFAAAPLNFCKFPKLRIVDISSAVSFDTADAVAARLARCQPQLLVLGSYAAGNDPALNFKLNQDKANAADRYLRPFRIKW